MNNYLILSTDSIIPWIALPNKCSFLFFTIHLPPVEEGEFLLYIMLKRDMDAVENAVAYDYSNGFVEGTNSRLKMIKRTMYGRCRKQLLEAKLRYVGYYRNG